MATEFKGYKITAKLEIGASPVQKYLLQKDEHQYLLRLFDVRFMNSRFIAISNMEELIIHGVNVPKVLDYGILEDKSKGYAILEWVEGKPLDKLLKDQKSQFEYGIKVGIELLKMHSIGVESSIDIYSKYITSIQKKLSKINVLNIKLKYINLIEEYIKNNSKILLDKNPSIIHGDFHPGNIVVNDNKRIYFIDMDVCKKDYAWSDLSSNSCNMNFPSFYSAVIAEYFNYQVPEEFWIVYNLYGCLHCLEYLLYSHRMENKTVEDGLVKIREFLEFSSYFNKLKPNWFDDKIISKRRYLK